MTREVRVLIMHLGFPSRGWISGEGESSGEKHERERRLLRPNFEDINSISKKKEKSMFGEKDIKLQPLTTCTSTTHVYIENIMT